MPRNSRNNSLGRFDEIMTLAKTYSLKSKYFDPEFKSKSAYSRMVISQINHIDEVMNVLCEPYKTIINKTFFERDKNDLYWWAQCYPKTTFYRLRTRAIKSFLLAYQVK